MTIYSEIILDHYQHPKNKGNLTQPTASCHVANPLCGDKIDMFVKIENGKVVDIKFDGRGCAISTASASILTEYAKNRSVTDLKKLNQKSIIKLLGIELGVNRIKCALLPLEALHKLI